MTGWGILFPPDVDRARVEPSYQYRIKLALIGTAD